MKQIRPTVSAKIPAAIRRNWQRLQQPGKHWFFLLYLAGLLAVTLLAMLLKNGMKLL